MRNFQGHHHSSKSTPSEVSPFTKSWYRRSYYEYLYRKLSAGCKIRVQENWKHRRKGFSGTTKAGLEIASFDETVGNLIVRSSLLETNYQSAFGKSGSWRSRRDEKRYAWPQCIRRSHADNIIMIYSLTGGEQRDWMSLAVPLQKVSCCLIWMTGEREHNPQARRQNLAHLQLHSPPGESVIPQLSTMPGQMLLNENTFGHEPGHASWALIASAKTYFATKSTRIEVHLISTLSSWSEIAHLQRLISLWRREYIPISPPVPHIPAMMTDASFGRCKENACVQHHKMPETVYGSKLSVEK